MLPILVLEPIVDALALQKSAYKIEVSFPILHAVSPAGETTLSSHLEVFTPEPMSLKHLVEYIDYRLSLKDAAVGGPSEEPEPGHNSGVVTSQASLIRSLAKSAHDPIEEALFS